MAPRSPNNTTRYFVYDDRRMLLFPYRGITFDIHDRGWWSRVYEYAWLQDIANELATGGGTTAIDIATGNQHPGAFILNDAGLKTSATDLIDLSLHLYKNLFNNIEYIVDDITSTRIKKKFNLVVCVSVLEHIAPKLQPAALNNLIDLTENYLAITVDMPGFEYKTDIELYQEIILNRGMHMDIQETPPQNRVTSDKCVASDDLRARKLNCYRIIAWRDQL